MFLYYLVGFLDFNCLDILIYVLWTCNKFDFWLDLETFTFLDTPRLNLSNLQKVRLFAEGATAPKVQGSL